MGFLVLQPLIFGRWELSASGGMDERGLYTRFDLYGEWLITGEDMALIFNLPFVYNSYGLSLTDTKLGTKVRFLENGYMDFHVLFPTGRLSSRNPAAGLTFGRYMRRDSLWGVFLKIGGIFTASTDTNEFSYFNKVSDRRAYRHMFSEILYYKELGITFGFGTGIRGDYAYSINQFWTSLKLAVFIIPYIEVGSDVWIYKPRPEVVRFYILANFFI